MTRNRPLPAILFAAALLILTGAAALAQGTVLQGVATVIDGDTLEIHGQRIRLHGIDAPESGQSCKDASGIPYLCGQRAALALADRVGRGTVTCRQQDTDRYGRIVAVCHLGALDLGLWMVANGHALSYRRYSTDYVEQEEFARHTRRGFWAGSFIAPWDWRQGARPSTHAGSKTSPPTEHNSGTEGCVIKGNISRRSGERIYHVPGQEHYAATRISPGKGERWFCSEAEARAAGWRRARR